MTKDTFSGEDIEPGSGIMFVRKNGEVLHFKSSKSLRNMLKLGRINRHIKWTEAFREHRGGK